MKLAIIVGHNKQAQGAMRIDNGQSEFQFNTKVAAAMVSMSDRYPGLELGVFNRTKGGGYKAEIRRVYTLADDWGADATIELHFNGGPPGATGTETLSSGSPLSLKMAAAFQKHMLGTLGLRDRGIKTIGGKDRGGMSLISGKAPAILLEPFFGSRATDVARIDTEEKIGALARCYMAAAVEAFEGFPRKDLTESRTMKAASRQRTAQTAQILSGAAVGVSEVVRNGAADLRAEIDGSGLTEVLPWLPYVSIALAFVVLGATIYSRVQTTFVEEARIDDNQRGLR